MNGSVTWQVDVKTGEAVVIVSPPPDIGEMTVLSLSNARSMAIMLESTGAPTLAAAIRDAVNHAETVTAGIAKSKEG